MGHRQGWHEDNAAREEEGKGDSVNKQQQNTGTISRSIHTIVFGPSKQSISTADVSAIWVCVPREDAFSLSLPVSHSLTLNPPLVV